MAGHGGDLPISSAQSGGSVGNDGGFDQLSDESHFQHDSIRDISKRAYNFTLNEDMIKKWRQSPDVIKTWNLAGWDAKGLPVFAAFLGGPHFKDTEYFYDHRGVYMGHDGSVVRYNLSNREWYVWTDRLVVTAPDMRLCRKTNEDQS